MALIHKAKTLGGSKPILIGSFYGNGTIDVSSYANEKTTASNFILSVTSISGTSQVKQEGITYSYAWINGSNPTFSYNNQNKTISTSGCSISVTNKGSDNSQKYAHSTIYYNVYYIA